MNNEAIKKFKTPITDMPPISSITEGYSLRYRIVSSDKNRTSHWSPIELITPEYTFVPGIVEFNKSGNIANLVWDSVTINKIDGANTFFIRKAVEYDVWVRWDRGSGDGDWIYDSRYEGTSFSMPVPSTYKVNGIIQPSPPNRASFEVYLKGYPIQRGDGIPLALGTPFLKVYQVYNETV